MFGSAISRWTMFHFGVALSFFLLAQLVMVAGGTFPAISLSAPTILATVHLLTLGWLTVLMLGALHPPCALARPPRHAAFIARDAGGSVCRRAAADRHLKSSSWELNP